MVTIEVTGKDGLVDMLDVDYFSIIFDHRFAKAFWGEEENVTMLYSNNNHFLWQYHLQQMVIEDNPTDYLEKFL